MRHSPAVIYLLCFSTAVAHAKHYVGSAPVGALATRIAEHQRGSGARLTQVAVERGAILRLARVWLGTRSDEVVIKRRHNNRAKHCPICRRGDAAIDPNDVDAGVVTGGAIVIRKPTGG